MILKFKERSSRKQDLNGIFTGGPMTAEDTGDNYAKVIPHVAERIEARNSQVNWETKL